MKNKNKPHPHDTRLHLMLWRYRKIKNLRAPSDKDLRRALLDEYKDEIKDLRRVLRETDDLARAKLPLCYKLGYMGNDRWSAWDFLSIRPHDKIRNPLRHLPTLVCMVVAIQAHRRKKGTCNRL